ncbi:type II secretion system protein [Neobacillus niacini]|uniref:type IV pilus modification PilV family protein n=1 Tax=Neobacillus niacini TaxID=86668 RepID=UPI00285D6D72|nr:type II secretion system protein [Neobacillus niacini]MDR7001471.1 prepilin-type N-terminal cleavage/methylation domain-containing protein [Neobacillus niacini]
MCFDKNQKGLTLVEVLVSVVILSIILLSIMKLFPQMVFMNIQNLNKSQAINTAKQVLVTWQNSNDVKNYLDDNTTGSLPGLYNDDGTYYYCETSEGSFSANIKIKKASDLSTGPIEEHFIQVSLINDKGIKVSETFGYIKVD